MKITNPDNSDIVTTGAIKIRNSGGEARGEKAMAGYLMNMY